MKYFLEYENGSKEHNICVKETNNIGQERRTYREHRLLPPQPWPITFFRLQLFVAFRGHKKSSILQVHGPMFEKIVEGWQDVAFGPFQAIQNQKSAFQHRLNRKLIDKVYLYRVVGAMAQFTPLFQIRFRQIRRSNIDTSTPTFASAFPPGINWGNLCLFWPLSWSNLDLWMMFWCNPLTVMVLHYAVEK